jgi:hypothetical protein
MAIALVSAASAYADNVTKNVTANNLVVYMASGTSGTWGTPVSSGAATTGSWTTGTTGTNGSDVTCRLWWAKVTGSGSLTVTVSGPGDLGCSIHEYSGADTTSPVDTSNSNTGTGSPCSVSLTGVDDGSAIVMIGADEAATATYTAASGYTRQTYESSHCHATLDRVASGTGSYTPSFTQSATVVWAAAAGAFLASGGAPATTPSELMMMGVG